MLMLYNMWKRDKLIFYLMVGLCSVTDSYGVIPFPKSNMSINGKVYSKSRKLKNNHKQVNNKNSIPHFGIFTKNSVHFIRI